LRCNDFSYYNFLIGFNSNVTTFHIQPANKLTDPLRFIKLTLPLYSLFQKTWPPPLWRQDPPWRWPWATSRSQALQGPRLWSSSEKSWRPAERGRRGRWPAWRRSSSAWCSRLSNTTCWPWLPKCPWTCAWQPPPSPPEVCAFQNTRKRTGNDVSLPVHIYWVKRETYYSHCEVLGRGCHMCTDCKALWGTFLICENGLYKLKWIELNYSASSTPNDLVLRMSKYLNFIQIWNSSYI